MKQFLKKIIVAVLQCEAKLVLKKYKPKIVAITGSVGKTSTKDAVYSVLAPSFFVRKSSKSFNSEIGVPLTILGLPNAWNNPLAWLKNIVDGFKVFLFSDKYPEWLVLEVGADRPGDIESIAFWLKPDISIITRLSDVPVHIEFFNSAEQVRHEKSQLIRALSEKGFAILNADDTLVSSLRPLTKGKVITFGSLNTAHVAGSDFKCAYDETEHHFPQGVLFKVSAAGKSVPVKVLGSLGKQHMYTCLAALSVAHALHLDIEKAAAALAQHDAPPGRMKILSGVNNTCILDDTYNSSPVAAHEALETLKGIVSPGRKVVVLGDMLELGEYSTVEHEKLGTKAADVASVLYTVGVRSQDIYNAARKAGFPQENLFHFDDSVSASESVSQHIQAGDIILVKGSQGVRMEKVVEKILAEPEKASELLVRQEVEWKNR